MHQKYIANVYASALYSVCGNKLNLEVGSLLEIVLGTDGFFLSNRFAAHIKLDVLRKMAMPMELFNFCAIVISKKRYAIFESILTAYLQIVKKENGEADISVESYIDLDDEDKTQISSIMMKQHHEVKKVNIQNVINKTLLGGFVIKFRSCMIDLSISTGLKNLKNASVDALSFS